MTSLPTNNELHQCLAGLYLGGPNITSKVEWIYAKARHCHVLCAKGADKSVLNPTPATFHGIFTVSQHPFKLVPDGGFQQSTVTIYFGHVSLQEAMARTNAWARLERIMDESLLGYKDFPTYIKNLKGLEKLMLGGTHHHYSLVNEEGANAPQIKVIHRMFESCWDNIHLPATPQQEYETKSKMRYKLTPGNHAVALRLANTSHNSTATADSPRVLQDKTAETSGETEHPEVEREPSTTPTEPCTTENKGKVLLEDYNNDDGDDSADSDDDSVDGFLAPKFGLQHWPVSQENVPVCDKMFEERRWQTNPLRVYHEGDGVIPPTDYASALPGATVQISFTIACHLIGSSEGKKATFSARIEEIIVLRPPTPLVSSRTNNGSPSKHQFSGPSFSPVKRRKLEKSSVDVFTAN
ncbi:uncharacterized protein EI90DRAFT_3019979 [Cantharellus anzutake]|uniref:uncharacterized protein n=1 Tax=Cantharellus anzutake TaxID=1750568 RepID=UPI0019038A33|nr:uncharacterized protein EI90DRAFT_3019979 [Cantharellus anzutake]KAF8322919.1 hypothetical protein EI90DRAFT_3019979 [Cantharellus anzutake]